MKAFKKLSLIALSAMLALSGAACGDSSAQVGSSENEGFVNNSSSSYVDPNTAFTKYDNINYNEYLMGEDCVIKNQWLGYGIGDPFVMRYNGMYYLYCSSLDAEAGVRGYKSADLVNWVPMTGTDLAYGYVSQDPVTKAAYAPEVYYYNGTFYMYTSPGGNGHYVLTSTSPEGPFVKATDNFGLAIDGSVLIDDDENMYFTYASSGGIRIAKMTDMLTINTVSTPILNNTSIGGWTEGSYILKRDGIYYITYTGTHVNSDGYRIAYSTADKITTGTGALNRNAFTKAELNPLVLKTEGQMKGIGHSSTVMGPDMDSYYLAYHSLNSSGGPNRSFALDRLLFNGKQMSVDTALEDSVTPTLPEFYATGTDSAKFDTAGDLVLSKTSANANFTVEYNLSGATASTYVFGYVDENNYNSVNLDLTAKTVTLSKTVAGQSTTVESVALAKNYSADALHSVRVAAKDGKVDVVFDNMTKINDAALNVAEGKVGYKAISGATVGYTAYSNVAMGMSDQREAKQATGWIGASTYLYEDTYSDSTNLTGNSGVKTLTADDCYNLDGVKTVLLENNYDYVTYLTNFRKSGRYGIELVYRAADAGKKIGIRLANGTIYRCQLPAVNTGDSYVKALVGEFNVNAGVSLLRMECLGSDVEFACFRFIETSAVTPVYEQTLENYAATGADYKTIWKLKDGGHYAKAGTRQLVYFGDNTITDFTLEVDMKLEGNTGTSNAGIVFHAQNYAASSFDTYRSIQAYYVAVSNNQIALHRLNFPDGSMENLDIEVANNPGKTSDTWFSLKIQARGNTMKVWSGNTLVLEVTDAWGFSNGKLGLYTNGAAVIYKNLKVSA